MQYNLKDKGFLQSTMMGPNALKVAQELTFELNITEKMRVLDLGSGTGLTSLFLATKYGCTVFAADFWNHPSETYERIQQFGLGDRIVPLRADGNDLPFAHGYFDLIVSVDAYHYFGTDEHFLDEKIAPFVKKGGLIAISIPGIKKEFTDGIPEPMAPYIEPSFNFHSCAWWKKLWEQSQLADVVSCREMDCFEEAWNDWLACENPYAIEDRDMLRADAGRYMNLVAIVARVR